MAKTDGVDIMAKLAFHNLGIDVINAETKKLDHNAHLLYEKAEVKKKCTRYVISLLR